MGSSNSKKCPNLWVGIGCRQGASCDQIVQAIAQVCQAHDLSTAEIAGIATVDRKATEPGLLQFCRDRHLPLLSFTPTQLSTIPVPNPSVHSQTTLGIPSVAEAAAILAAGAPLIVTKQVVMQDQGGVTVAISRQADRSDVPKIS